MENVYTTFFRGKEKHRHSSERASSLPFFNTNQRKQEKILSPEIIKMQMLQERLDQLEKQKKEENEQIDALISYQMEQNRFNPYNNPNTLVLSASNILPNIGYSLDDIKPIKKFNRIKKIKNNKYNMYNIYKKEKKLQEYKNTIEDLKYLLEKERNKRKRNKYLKNKLYLPLKKDITYFMDDMNNTIQKKIQNDNNMLNANINEVQNSFDEIKYLLNNKIDKLELKQNVEFENFKNELINTDRQNNNKRKALNELIESKIDNNLYQMSFDLDEKLRNQKELDNIRHENEMEELRYKYKLEEIENRKMKNRLKFNKMRRKIINHRLMINQYPSLFMYKMPIPIYKYKKRMNYSNYI